MWKGEWRQTAGVRAAGYGIGFFIYGVIGLLSGHLLGLDSIHFVHEQRFPTSVACIVLGLGLIALGWKRPE